MAGIRDFIVMSKKRTDNKMIVRHKNNLATYLSDRLLDLQMLQKVGPGRDRHFFASQPKPFLALSNNSYDLSLMLKYLDSKLITLENKQHYKSYS
jgi:hypothetical protein